MILISCSSPAKECGPFYTHMGPSPTLKGLRDFFEEQTGWEGEAIRFEKIYIVPKEGKNGIGCPITKYVRIHCRIYQEQWWNNIPCVSKWLRNV